MATALTIAGSDSAAGAGIQADLKTFAALGVYGTSAIAALTAQNTTRVTGVQLVPASFVVQQIDAVASDLAIDAVKTGMLGSAAIVEAVVGALNHWALPRIVVDPVMVAKSGDRLIARDAIAAVRERLLPLAVVVTPNRLEAEVLLDATVRTREDAAAACRALVARGARAAIVKGGHFDEADVIDLLYDGQTFHEFRHARQHTRNTHGTGCTFASAIAACLARGAELPAAVQEASDYVAGAIAHGLAIGHGHGPLDHFWAMRPSK
jgi:hydroxymethylpyrimidine/phosphomethylpyrimidine kinase